MILNFEQFSLQGWREEERELVALLLLSFGFLVTANVLWLFLMVLWVGLQCVIVVFPDHTHLLFATHKMLGTKANSADPDETLFVKVPI